MDDEGMGEVWREYRRAQQERRAERLPGRTEEILALKAKGYDVRQLSEYQFRIDGALDLYPIHRRYHALKVNQRGDYKSALAVAVKFLKTPLDPDRRDGRRAP